MKKILVIDNHDSFIYNLIEYLREIPEVSITTIQNHEIPHTQISNFDGILLSPGAGLPFDYPEMIQLIEKQHQQCSIFGVCLGHQAIANYFGGALKRLSKPKHGHTSRLNIIEPADKLFYEISQSSEIGRYHSWVIDQDLLPECLEVIAYDDEKNIMAIKHTTLPIWGVQFHPESIITKEGKQMLHNWINQL